MKYLLLLFPLSVMASGYDDYKTTPINYYPQETIYQETTYIESTAICAANTALASLVTGSHKGSHGHTTVTSALGNCGSNTGLAVGLQKHRKDWVFKVNLAKSQGEAVSGVGVSYTFD